MAYKPHLPPVRPTIKNPNQDLLDRNHQAIKDHDKEVMAQNGGHLYGPGVDKVDSNGNHYIDRNVSTGSGGDNGSGAAPTSGGGGGGGDSGPDYEAIARRMREALDKSLADSLAAREAAYNKTADTYKQNYNSQMGELKSAYDFGEGRVNAGANNALKDAYLLRMENARTLPQVLSAQGLTGGMTETTNARLLNAYGNQRNNIESNRADSLGELLRTYNSNQAKAQQQYNTLLADAYNRRQEGEAADRAAHAQQLANIMAYLG